ncbi:hypothetical protein NDU88_010780 [Pleurodeles waltl]|uniref:Uncharacterized protein n=1 Tax=Pleurodeles waltl TaxID=8319 RepID=A0AAV7PVW7_PLEWA|nr:hypothetical protein NDU88_010780 [Pleurodeles waltl]
MESQLDSEKEYFSGEFDNEHDDEYVLDLEYKDEREEELENSFKTRNSEDLLDPLGGKLVEPKDIRHPQGKELWSLEHVASYIKHRLRKPLEKDERNIMRAECSRPVIEEKVCLTPNLDPEMITYLLKLGRDTRKGLEKSLKQVQDKLLDVLGPLGRIFDTLEDAYLKGKKLDVHLLRGWCQRAICFFGYGNAGLLAERRKTVLMRVNPKLSDLASKESSEEARGLLFRDGMVKALSKYVRTFTSLDKAHFLMKRVFSTKDLCGRASRRGQLASRQILEPNIMDQVSSESSLEVRNFTPRKGGDVHDLQEREVETLDMCKIREDSEGEEDFKQKRKKMEDTQFIWI